MEHKSPINNPNNNEMPTTSATSSCKKCDPKFELSEMQKEDIKKAFELFDTNRSGVIQIIDLKYAFRALGFKIENEEIRRILLEFDKEKTGYITYNKFEEMMKIKLAEKDTEGEILQAFRLFDVEGKGEITFEDLLCVGRELGLPVTNEELNNMMDIADIDHDGTVGRDEFLHTMKRANFH